MNPFLGVVAVVKTADARALSVDGVHWQIQVSARPPRGLWSEDGYQDKYQYFRFGAWSEAQGLSRVPLNPMLDAGRMVEASRGLIGRVAACQTALPFPFLPELELWLLDTGGLPLALLATAVEGSELDTLGSSAWSAGGRGERPFKSRTLTHRGAPERDASGRFRHAEALERQVHAAAGRRLDRQWFRREAGGGGVGLDVHASDGFAGRRLGPEAFPLMPLRTSWPDAESSALVADYVGWLAPYLLTLPGLPRDVRRVLEREAAQHALVVDALWRLYPEVLDQSLLSRARVEARLRRANC
ncbi:MAG: hypothetical protein WCA32_18495 [Chromatiaceae bacterium]